MKLFPWFLIVSILTHIIRTIYETLKHSNRIDPENRIIFSIIFTNMALLWVSWFGLCFTDPNTISLNPVLRYAGAVILISGSFLFFASLVRLKRFENYHGNLITNGVFRFFRHPMYVGFICWMFGSALFAQSWVAMILAIVYTANILVWKKFEEIQLLKVFPEYGEYMKRTWF